ncbi:MAG: hypothetical protein EBX41_06340 [Chitinophagia bacterium]|nr:hypothetical protein [Chitinophagia bacterium]
MKLLFACLVFLCAGIVPVAGSHAQRLMDIKPLYYPANIHIMSAGYQLSFALKDIEKTLQLARQAGDSTFPATTQLDSLKNYSYEVNTDLKLEYHYPMQYLIQHIAGGFLLLRNRVMIIDRKKKLMPQIIFDATPVNNGLAYTRINIYHPTTHELIFVCRMPVAMYGQDFDIDD